MGAENYLAVDIGATKTLFAVFDTDGQMVYEKKIKTEPDYGQFKQAAAAALKELDKFRFKAACCAIPGRLDLEHGVAVALGNENWRDVPVKDDFAALLPGVMVLAHNDAKLAGLSEARLLGGQYNKVLYLTISTGIGGGVITAGKIDPDFDNFEPGQMVFEFQGQTRQWEDISSGRVLKERYGQLASEIQDEKIWQDYVKTLVPGFENLLAVIQPDAVIIGGGVGTHFDKFQPYLETELAKINNPLVPVPPLLKAQRPEEAVIYGCYDYIRQNNE
jgi:predicted NBD/HSP70 family sugar kinase